MFEREQASCSARSAAGSTKVDEADEEKREAQEDYEGEERARTRRTSCATEKKMEVLVGAGGGGGDSRMMVSLPSAWRRQRRADARLDRPAAHARGGWRRRCGGREGAAAARRAEKHRRDRAVARGRQRQGGRERVGRERRFATADAKGSRLLGEATRLLDATLAEAKVAAGELKEAAEEGYKEPADWFVAGANIEEGNDELERAYASDGARVEKVVARLAADLQERGSAQAANLERLQREIDVLVAAQLRMKREVSELRADYSSKDAADVIAALRARLGAARERTRRAVKAGSTAQHATKGDLERLEATVREYAGVAEVEAVLEPRLADVDAELARQARARA